MAGARLQADWHKPASDIEDALISAVKLYYDRSPQALGRAADPDHESYEIGALAGVLLDVKGIDWKNDHAKEIALSPASTLLTPLAPAAHVTADAEISRAIARATSAEAAKAQRAMQPLIDGYNDPTIPLFVLPTLDGSYSVERSYQTTLGGHPAEAETGVTTAPTESTPELNIAGASWLRTDDSSACGPSDTPRPIIPLSTVTVTPLTATFAGEQGISGNAPITTTTLNGRTIHCVGN